MGEFKPMVKMETTEPSIELKLKKGGSAHKKMKGDTKSGHKPMKKMMDGGVMGALANTPALVGGASAPIERARVPVRPSLAARRRAMTVGKPAVSRPMMKEGGESKAEHKSEMKKISKVESELKSHEGKKASAAHKGLKSGGKCYANGGIIKSESGKTKMVTAEGGDHSPAKTGDVKLGNAGGYKTGGVIKGNAGGYKTGGVALGNAGGFKKGGSSKKAFASGGSVNDEGKATSMPQGAKKPSTPVSISKLSGTFKKGGNVSSKKLQNVFKNENAPAVKASKAKTDLVYSPYQKKAKKFADGGTVDLGTQATDMTDGSNPSLDAQKQDYVYPETSVTDIQPGGEYYTMGENPVMYSSGASSGRPYDPSFNPMIQRGNPKIRPQEPPKDLKVKSNRPGRPIVVQPGPNVFPRPNQSIPKNPMGLKTKDQYKMFYNADGTRRPMVKKGGRVKK